jgi:quinoprotein glucose dehydrogenase
LNKKLYSGFACSVLSLVLLLPFLTFALSDSEVAGNWPMPGRDPGGTRYSTLTQITPANVSQLKVAWVYHMKPPGAATLRPSQDQPLVVGSTMYVVTPYSRVVALDSTTGR